jgi:hypothetical protein
MATVAEDTDVSPLNFMHRTSYVLLVAMQYGRMFDKVAELATSHSECMMQMHENLLTCII